MAVPPQAATKKGVAKARVGVAVAREQGAGLVDRIAKASGLVPDHGGAPTAAAAPAASPAPDAAGTGAGPVVADPGAAPVAAATSASVAGSDSKGPLLDLTQAAASNTPGPAPVVQVQPSAAAPADVTSTAGD